MAVAGGWKNNSRKAHLAQRLIQNFASKLFSYSKPWKNFPTISVDGHNRHILYITSLFDDRNFYVTISSFVFLKYGNKKKTMHVENDPSLLVFFFFRILNYFLGNYVSQNTESSNVFIKLVLFIFNIPRLFVLCWNWQFFENQKQ